MDQEKMKNGECGCGHDGHSCGGTCLNVHAFCHRNMCLVKVVGVLIVLVMVFLLGVCAGAHEGRERYGSRYDRGMSSGRMMIYSNEDGYGDVGYGMMDALQPTQVTTRIINGSQVRGAATTTAQ